jgi:hypothetical protein
VEQRIAWTYRHHHSRTCTLEAFTDTVYAVLATHPAWESLQAAAKVSAAREAPPTGDFADHLEWWRRTARWSIEDLAGEAGLSKDAVQKHLSRTGMPYPRNLTKYEQALSTRFEREVILPIPPRPPRRRRRPAKNPRRIR